MHVYRTFFVSAAILIRITAVANADPGLEQGPRPLIAALPPGDGAAIVTPPPSIANLASPNIPSAGSSHFPVWSGYDSDVSLHPYTSGMGPCPQGRGAGCQLQHGHYERAPFH